MVTLEPVTDRGTWRRVRLVGGIATILLGVVWVGQGIGLIKGSFMTGQAFWAVMGALCIGAGATTLVRLRRPPD